LREERHAIDLLDGSFTVLMLDPDIAAVATRIRRTRWGIKLPDVII
jgi:hypothetical protein